MSKIKKTINTRRHPYRRYNFLFKMMKKQTNNNKNNMINIIINIDSIYKQHYKCTAKLAKMSKLLKKI
jgi:hypothetical protein